MCSLSAATRWRHSDNCYNGKDRKLGFLVTIYSLPLVNDLLNNLCNGLHMFALFFEDSWMYVTF